ncbi:MAG: Lipopolysaccharide biosynthesis protein WzxC [Solirubrobacterales bacterium]|jgi:O-antigen/teichoic acid export membrane protein|nr:Lipopolysaccharide biosynthesis protein WzxC [Solirubrobacterales bacterium]
MPSSNVAVIEAGPETRLPEEAHGVEPGVSPGGAREASLSNVVRGISWVGGGHVISQLAWFGSLFVIAAMVHPRAFGSVTIAMVMIQVAWLVVGSGTRGSMVVSPTFTRGQLWYAVAVNVASGLAMGLIVLFLGASVIHVFAPGANTLVLRILAFSVAIYGMSIVPLALLQKNLQFKRHAAANAGAAGLASVIAVIAALMGAGVWALVGRQILFQALLAGFAWRWARALLPAPSAERTSRLRALARPEGAAWFFGLALISFVALNIDYVIVGHFTDVARLGLYSLAFTIAFAPMTQFAWQIGKVLFPAAARTEQLDVVGTRSGKAVRLTAALLFPLVPPAVALAPILLPDVLGPAWRPMVLPCQILLVAGIAHAVLAIIREFMLGSGSVAFCVRVEGVWLIGMAGGLYAGVRLGGITGAAIAHAALVVPLIAVYVIWGARRIGSSASQLWRALQGVLGPVAVEAAVIALMLGLARATGAGLAASSVAAAVTGFGTAILLMWRADPSPLAQGRSLLMSARVGASA